MAKKYLVPIDHNKLESYNFRFQNLASDPGTPVEGQTFYDTVIKSVKFRSDSAWVIIDPAKVADAYIPLAKVNGAAPLASPTFTGLVTTPAGSTGQAGGLKLTSGALKTTPTAGDSGSIEYNGTNLSFIDSGGVRRTLGVSGAGIQTLTLTAPGAGFSITPSGTGSDPIYTFALTNDLAALEALSTTGVVRRTGSDAWSTGNVSLTTEVTGTLPVANGGTGVTASTGSVAVVLSTSPTLAGTPLSTTAAVDTNTTQIATTAFVIAQAASATPAALGSAAVGSSTRFARGDHVHAMPTLTQVGNPTADRSMNNFKLTTVADPTADQDAANKRYVDNAIAGLPWKEEVRVATTADIATLAGGAPTVVDGITLVLGDRILVKNQATGSQNGLYTVTTLGTGANGTWTRAVDADAGAELSGMAVFVVSGTVNGGMRYVATNTGTITVGSTAVTFAVFDAVVAAYTAGNGLQLIGQAFSVKLPASSGLVSDGTGLYIDTATVVRKYAATIGDNSTTSIAVTHSMGTLDVTVQVYEISSGDTIECDVKRNSTSQVTLAFAVAPATSSLRVVVHG